MKKYLKTISSVVLLTLLSNCSTNNDKVSSEIQEKTVCPNGFCEKIFYGTDAVQWLNLYQAQSLTPTPVYIWSHPNGSSPANPGSAYTFPETVKNTLLAAGISVISWESVQQVQDEADLSKTETDFNLVMTWLRANAEKYNININKVVVGGRSRGSWATWPGTNVTINNIKGYYGVQAFPDTGWLLRDPRNLITPASVPLFLTYDQPLGTTDNHKPENGFLMKDKYTAVGIGQKASVYYNLPETKLHDSLVVFINRCTR